MRKEELLNDDETARLLKIVKEDKIKHKEFAAKNGAKRATVSRWLSTKKIPARCRSYLELLELKKKINQSLK